MLEMRQIRIKLVAAACGLAALAGCATPPPPPPPPAPPPAPIVIPSRPLPPSGAVSMMAIPALGMEGLRRTVNYDLSIAQTVWNLRSALNVAALNCQDPEYANLLPAYSHLLTNNKRELTAINQKVNKEFKDRYGSEGRDAQDTYMTQVYNYFALPPTQDEFCRVSARIAGELLLMAPGDLESFSTRSLQSIEAVFEDFYRAYEGYRANVALWDAQYGPLTPVNPASYTGPAIYTPVDQGFGPEQTGQPEFISEAVVEGQTAEMVVQPVFEGQPIQSVPQPIAGEPEIATGSLPAGEQPVFVSNPVIEPIPNPAS